MRPPFLLLAVMLAFGFFDLQGETVKDREGAVRADRSKMEKSERWIYNDWERGFEEAKTSGKPLMVVLRCVPCLACAGIDASILTEPDLEPLLDRFVCVRLINANTIDLSLFQFDYDLSFSALFFNGDGSVYGRYGSWTHQKDPYNKTVIGFERALKAALSIHQEYPENKVRLAGKRGKKMPVNDPLELPELAGKYKRELDWEGKVVQSCVHCHQVSDAIRATYRDQKKMIPEQWVYPMPPPETIGLTLEPDQVAHVAAVAENSIAEKAGFQKGDELVQLEGQPLISIADVVWVLHHAPDRGALQARVKRNGEAQDLRIRLPEGWRRKSDIARRVGTWPMRAMATGGLLLEDLPREERQMRGIANDQMALLVKHVGQYGEHAAAKKAGFQKDDVIVEVDGISRALSESELIGHLLAKHLPGERVQTTVLRNGNRVKLILPMQ